MHSVELSWISDDSEGLCWSKHKVVHDTGCAGDEPVNSSDPTGQFVVGWERSPRYHDLFLSAAALAAGEGALCATFDDPEICPPPGFETIIGGALNSPGNVAIGSLEGTIHNILSEVLNIDTCPGGTFECPSDGAPLFGIPMCDPRFCMSDFGSAAQSGDAIQDCVSGFYNSKTGNVVKFFCPISVLPGWNPEWGQNAKDWFETIAGKGTGAFAGNGSGPTELTTLNEIRVIGSPFELGAEKALSWLGENVVAPAMIAATLIDVGAHSRCYAKFGAAPAEAPAGP